MFIKNFLIVSFISLVLPMYAYAQIRITEVMYDPAGSDTKREWIEIFNEGNIDIDLSTYFLFENNVYHKLVAQTDSIIHSGSYAIIADSITEVLADYSDFTGLIFDSVFSLTNIGESISVANPQKVLTDTFEYTSEMGANNTGQSLQINGVNVITASPTFGIINKTESESIEAEATSTSSNSSGSSSSNDSSHSQQIETTTYQPTTFKVGAGRDRVVSINTPIDFEAYISKENLIPRYLWNFGDFKTETGRKNTHIYRDTGIYEVVLEAKTKGYTGISRTEVQVVKPQLTILKATSTISIHNDSKQEINIGGFVFDYEKGQFKIPSNTIVKGENSIFLDVATSTILKSFQYPNSEIYQ